MEIQVTEFIHKRHQIVCSARVYSELENLIPRPRYSFARHF
jgi:hypothetical protein